MIQVMLPGETRILRTIYSKPYLLGWVYLSFDDLAQTCHNLGRGAAVDDLQQTMMCPRCRICIIHFVC